MATRVALRQQSFGYAGHDARWPNPISKRRGGGLGRDRKGIPQVRRGEVLHELPVHHVVAQQVGQREEADPANKLLSYEVGEPVNAVGDDPGIGSAASRTLDYHDEQRIYSLGDGFLPSGDAFNIARGMRYRGDLPMPRWVFGASGCTAFYRRSALERTGFLDENFWAYHEDIDLDFRLQLAGCKCLYVPEAVAYHVGGATGRKFNERVTFISGRNRWFVLFKNLPLGLWLRFAWPIARRAAQLAWWAVKGNVESRARCRGALASLACLPREWRKRRVIQRQRRASAGEIAALLQAHARLQEQLQAIAKQESP